MPKRKVCAVCGDRSQVNVRNLFLRDSDGEYFTVCMLCREIGKANAESVNNYKAGHVTKEFAEAEMAENAKRAEMRRKSAKVYSFTAKEDVKPLENESIGLYLRRVGKVSAHSVRGSKK